MYIGTPVVVCLSDTSCSSPSKCAPRSWRQPAKSTWTSTTSSCVEEWSVSKSIIEKCVCCKIILGTSREIFMGSVLSILVIWCECSVSRSLFDPWPLTLSPGTGPWEPDGQPVLGMAGRRGLGQHHRAGEADQLPRHHHLLRAVPPWLEHLVHCGPARDRPPTRSVLFVVTVWNSRYWFYIK